MGPYFKLFDGSGPKRISRGKDDPLRSVLIILGQFSDRRCLAHPVDPDDHKDKRFLIDVNGLFPRPEDFQDFPLDNPLYLLWRIAVFGLCPVLDGLKESGCRPDPQICSNQELFQLVEEILVNRSSARKERIEAPHKPLMGFEESFFQPVKDTGSFRRSNFHQSKREKG